MEDREINEIYERYLKLLDICDGLYADDALIALTGAIFTITHDQMAFEELIEKLTKLYEDYQTEYDSRVELTS